jgi:HNH endonuclease
MIDLEKAQYKPVGYCIFCGSLDNLTREHILPVGFGGSSTIPKGACKICAEKTGKMEQEVLRGAFWPVRVFRDMRSRSKHADAPKELSFRIVRKGKETEISMPIDEVPIVVQFPIYPAPEYFAPKDSVKGINIRGVATVGFGEKLEEILRRLDASSISFTQSEKNPTSFPRLIAKFAYCIAFADGAFSRIIEERPPVVTAILGDTDDIGRYVGSIDEGGTSREGVLHYSSMHEDTQQGLLVSQVQLFADSQSPRYYVILGSLKSSDAKTT